MTHDTDVLVLVDDWEACERRLTQAGCRKLNVWGIGGATWAHEAVHAPVFDATGLPTAALPYLVVMKLLSGRAQDIAGITRMLGAADGPMLDQVRGVVARHIPEAADDVESMIVLGRMEYE